MKRSSDTYTSVSIATLTRAG